jgi:hypothetical protein
MFQDVLRRVAAPMLQSLGRVADAARPPAATPVSAQKPSGLQVLDGFDDALPAARQPRRGPSAASGFGGEGACGRGRAPRMVSRWETRYVPGA